ncbi:hypothetical protein [Paracoccus rhizosphaerae]|uniref:Uncharacterized protein n=1 Tax=Paracoccus rhizosphaerae TaxID=1133347 RepID=A0ABV6CR08_9RHOB|nr:hypothetical protein [Paracoccus rhizosphaerae]
MLIAEKIADLPDSVPGSLADSRGGSSDQGLEPIVSADPPDRIVIDWAGSDRLHGGEAAMREALARKLALSGISARLA